MGSESDTARTRATRASMAFRVLGILACAGTMLGAARPPSPAERGRQLFTGEALLTARMASHQETLPHEAVRCSNCHRDPSTPVDARSPATPDFGPAIDVATLTQPIARRGGPPSTYDRKVFCKLLREGVDPAHVMIPQTMPRYALNDSDCEALWIFLTTP